MATPRAEIRVDAREMLSLSGTDRFHGFGWLICVISAVERLELRHGQAAIPTACSHAASKMRGSRASTLNFTRKIERLEHSMGRTSRLRSTLFIVIILAILALFLFGEARHEMDSGIGVPLKNVVTFMMGFFAVLLGVWELHQNKMATRQLMWQYRNQLTHFTRARLHLARITAAGRRSEVLADLGKDSMMESYLRTIHRSQREHEPPSTGGG